MKKKSHMHVSDMHQFQMKAMLQLAKKKCHFIVTKQKLC